MSFKDIERIKKYISLTQEESIALTKRDNSPSVEITDCIADNLREKCIDKLQTHGFDSNYKPNTIGLIMEDLIDVLLVR